MNSLEHHGHHLIMFSELVCAFHFAWRRKWCVPSITRGVGNGACSFASAQCLYPQECSKLPLDLLSPHHARLSSLHRTSPCSRTQALTCPNKQGLRQVPCLWTTDPLWTSRAKTPCLFSQTPWP